MAAYKVIEKRTTDLAEGGLMPKDLETMINLHTQDSWALDRIVSGDDCVVAVALEDLDHVPNWSLEVGVGVSEHQVGRGAVAAVLAGLDRHLIEEIDNVRDPHVSRKEGLDEEVILGAELFEKSPRRLIATVVVDPDRGLDAL